MATVMDHHARHDDLAPRLSEPNLQRDKRFDKLHGPGDESLIFLKTHVWKNYYNQIAAFLAIINW